MQKLKWALAVAALIAATSGMAWAATALDVNATCAQGGSNFGLQVMHDGTNTNAFLIDDSPSSETRIIVQVYGKLDTANGYTMNNGDTHLVWRGRQTGLPGAVNRMQVRRRPDGTYTMAAWHLLDAGSEFIGEVFFNPGVFQCFIFDWQASSSPGAGDGTASIQKCSGAPKTVSNRNNNYVIDSQNLGSFAGIDAGTTGPICWDNFSSRRAP